MICLIVILGKKLKFLFLEQCPDSFMENKETLYVKYFSDNDNGFYDWLRCASGAVVGVRWFPYENVALKDERLAYLKKLTNLTIHKDLLEMAIYFSEERHIDESRSRDQDFLCNNLYLSSHGGCAISFSVSNLSEEEKISLLNIIGSRKI